MKKLSRYFLEPMSMLTHLLGTVAAVVGLVLLVVLSNQDPGKMLSLLVYGGSMVLLYLASTLYHGVKLPEPRRMWLNRLDHMAIFLLIAGTYTPIVYNLFPPAWRWWVLLPVWTVALVGMGFKLFSRRIHGFLNVSIYVILGWGGILPFVLATNLFATLSWQGFGLLLLGGLIYSLGFVVYYRHWPDPWPNVFGYHELWHLFVLGGSVCHYLFILFYIVPLPRMG